MCEIPRFARNDGSENRQGEACRRIWDRLHTSLRFMGIGEEFFLTIMIININNLHCLVSAINKNSPVRSGNAETIDAQIFWFKNLGMQSRMEGVCFKQAFLFLELLDDMMPFKIGGKTFVERKDAHTNENYFTRADRRNDDSFKPRATLLRKCAV